MVWKKMFVWEYGDGCLVLGHLWYLNVMITAYLSILSACRLPSSFCSRGYIVWKILFKLFKIFSYLEYPCWLATHIKFLLKRTYGFEEDVVWRIVRCMLGAGPIVTELNYFCFPVSLFCLLPPIKFLLMRTYSVVDRGLMYLNITG